MEATAVDPRHQATEVEFLLTMGQWLLWLAPVSGAHLVLLSIRWSEKSAALPVLSSNSAPMLTYCVTLMGCHP